MQQPRRKNARAVSLLLMAFFLSTMAGIYLQNSAHQQSMERTQEFVEKLAELQRRLLGFHLDLEEMVNGDGTIQPADLRRHMQRSLDKTRALRIAINTEQQLIPADQIPALLAIVDQLSSHLQQLERAAESRFEDQGSSNAGSTAEQQFDALFLRTMSICQRVERELKQVFQHSFTAGHQADVLLEAAQVLIVLALFAALISRDRQLTAIGGQIKSHRTMLRLEQQAHNATRNQLELVANVIERSEYAVVITDQNNSIRDVNPAFSNMTGYSKVEALGKTPSINKSGRHDAAFYQAMWQALDEEGHWEGEVWDRRKDGTIYPKWLNIHKLTDENGDVLNYLGMFSDLSSQKKNEEELRWLTYYDNLTRLPNRELFMFQLRHEIAAAERHSSKFAVISINLDNFHRVNDYFGFGVGDTLIKTVAHRFGETLRKTDAITRGAEHDSDGEDLVSRFSGDMFSVLLPDLKHGEDAARLIERLRHAIEQPFEIEGNQIHVTFSAGIAVYPDNGSNGQELLRCADRALSGAKGAGGECYRFYSDTMGERSIKKAKSERRLRAAIDNQELILHYQPKLNLETGLVDGVEALVRWPRGGKLVPPMEFIPLAEETGLIIPLGQWVLEQACREIQAFNQAHDTAIAVSVNLSSKQFSSGDLYQTVDNALTIGGLSAELLELEITESMVMNDVQHAAATMEKLKTLGVSIAIDDFGTGYSSLAYLKKFPVSVLKIDRSFVSDLEANSSDAEIVAAVCSMCSRMHMKVVAEGVENEAQLDYLKDLKCSEAQGFLIARPQPLEELTGSGLAFR